MFFFFTLLELRHSILTINQLKFFIHEIRPKNSKKCVELRNSELQNGIYLLSWRFHDFQNHQFHPLQLLFSFCFSRNCFALAKKTKSQEATTELIIYDVYTHFRFITKRVLGIRCSNRWQRKQIFIIFDVLVKMTSQIVLTNLRAWKM